MCLFFHTNPPRRCFSARCNAACAIVRVCLRACARAPMCALSSCGSRSFSLVLSLELPSTRLEQMVERTHKHEHALTHRHSHTAALPARSVCVRVFGSFGVCGPPLMLCASSIHHLGRDYIESAADDLCARRHNSYLHLCTPRGTLAVTRTHTVAEWWGPGIDRLTLASRYRNKKRE